MRGAKHRGHSAGCLADDFHVAFDRPPEHPVSQIIREGLSGNELSHGFGGIEHVPEMGGVPPIRLHRALGGCL